MEQALIPMQIVVLAAGHGKRMNNSELPKVLMLLKGKPIIKHLLAAIKEAGVSPRPVIVIGQKAEMVKEVLGSGYNYVFQAEQFGTGHAVACTRELLRSRVDNIMVLNGDQPLITPNTIRHLVESHVNSRAVITMATVETPDFNDWRSVFESFGRIKRNHQGQVVGIVEKKDASGAELKISEVNPAYYCFKADWLWNNLIRLNNNNAQGEYYLTDLISIACGQGELVKAVKIDAHEAFGVNTPEQLAWLSS